MELVLFRGKQYPVNYYFERTLDRKYITGKQQAKYCEYMAQKTAYIKIYSDSYFDEENNKHYFVFKKPDNGYSAYMEDWFKEKTICTYLIPRVRKGVGVDTFIIEKGTKKIIAQYTKDGFKKFYTATRKGRY
jgi:hypothetical protein